MVIPIIKDIHQKVLEAVGNGDNLDMSEWHKSCGTTHCRAGWVTTLAGEEGKALEELTSTEFAANVIYSKSSGIKVGPPRFFLSNDQSMADIELCAQLEKEGKTSRD
jgi:hypothetical protein